MPSASSSSSRSKAEDSPSPERALAELPVRSKLDELLKLARGRRRVLLLTHDNPDPDSIASAVALAFLLEKRAGIETRVVYGGIIGRAENLALVEVRGRPTGRVGRVVLAEGEGLALVDPGPRGGRDSGPARYPVEVVLG